MNIHAGNLQAQQTLSAPERLLLVLQDGLPIVERPYAVIAEKLGWSEDQVIEELDQLSQSDRVRRMGIVVKHRALGFKANAMVVWDIPDEEVDAVAARMAEDSSVTLCYQRPRRLPQWPYNLFCMIHGQQRDQVLGQLDQLVENLELQGYPHQPLFSTRCFKQCGGRYVRSPDALEVGATELAAGSSASVPSTSVQGAGHA